MLLSRTRRIFKIAPAVRGWRLACIGLVASSVVVGCKTPLREEADAELQRSLDATLAREAGSAAAPGSGFQAEAETSSVFESLKGQRSTLDAMGPQAASAGEA